ncbi:MAG: efflux RND transporter periplasmic adaptor subunit [Myxococcota bacterium]
MKPRLPQIHLPRFGLPLLVLLVGFAGFFALMRSRPPAEMRPHADARLLVRTLRVLPGDERLVVRAAGSVTARTESDLVPEVSGRVSWISPNLRPGGFFEADDVLLRLERGDYETALKRAQATLERARGELDLARQTLERQRSLKGRGAAAQAELDNASARQRVTRGAALEAEAAVEQAERDLERSELRARFAGRVLEKRIDLGQFVTRGTSVARVYAIDTAEIRLPIPDRELAFLDLPLDYRGEAGPGRQPRVVLRAIFAGREYRWEGRVVRTEGQIDPRTRMIHVVVEVDDPYGRGEAGDRPPLAVGLFVEAEIEGRLARDVFVLPREALRGNRSVLVVDAEERLRFREVDVLRAEGLRVIVRAGLSPGERVCVSPLETPVDGMRVRIAEEPLSDAVRADAGGLPPGAATP